MSADTLTRVLRDGYDRSAADYDDHFRALQRVKYATMLEAAGDALTECLRRGPVLDVGCGTGLFAEFLAAFEPAARTLVGIDLSAAMLARAGRRRIVGVQGDVAALPFASASCAAALSFTVLALWPEPERTRRMLDEIHRVLVPNGLLVITVLARVADELRAQLHGANYGVGCAHPCGQDVGYVCRRLS